MMFENPECTWDSGFCELESLLNNLYMTECWINHISVCIIPIQGRVGISSPWGTSLRADVTLDVLCFYYFEYSCDVINHPWNVEDQVPNFHMLNYVTWKQRLFLEPKKRNERRVILLSFNSSLFCDINFKMKCLQVGDIKDGHNLLRLATTVNTDIICSRNRLKENKLVFAKIFNNLSCFCN